ncbi:MAG: hypothetical protein FWH10_02370 [Oscillospiraceae bacterium]|nr:hypothetical protein [Oscillospiraceae bacterium]
MKKRSRIINLLLNKKGETLAESIAALLLLSLLLLTIAAIINVSFAMTRSALDGAKDNQDYINNIIRGNYPAETEIRTTINFKSESKDISASHKIILNDAYITAFVPD